VTYLRVIVLNPGVFAMTLQDNTLYTDLQPPPPKKQKLVSIQGTTESYLEIKCQLDATEIFIADLIACSTCFGHHYAQHQDLKSITQWLLPVVYAAASCKPDT